MKLSFLIICGLLTNAVRFTSNKFGVTNKNYQIGLTKNSDIIYDSSADSADGSIQTNLNHIYFYKSVSKESCLQLNIEINDMSKELQKHAIDYNIKPPYIYLHINSYGGSLYDGLSTVDTIKNSKVPIVSIVEGAAASAATLISIVCTYRYATEYSSILIHQLSSGMRGTYEEIKDHYENDTRLMNIMYEIYEKHTNIKKQQLKNILKRDLWLSTDKCLKYGLIDDIWRGSNS